MLSSALGLGLDAKDLQIGHVLVRSALVFVYVLGLLRVAKRRFMAQRDPLDILLSLLLASMISRAINGSAAFVPTLAGGLLLVLLHRFLSRLAFWWPVFERRLKGAPVVLATDGQVVEAALARHAMTREDLEEDLRLVGGIAAPEQAKCVRFERNGRVSVETKKS
jgi:uncharacterized membrane protein YcaP (DUF421 family)